MSLTIASDLVSADDGTTTVPSGVPTEATGEPIRLTVPEGTLEISGCASPSAFVTIFDNNTPIGAVVANNFGYFSRLIGSQGHGLTRIQIFQEDRFQNISSTAQFTTSLKAHEDNFLSVFLPPTVYHDKDPVVIGDHLIFRGFTCPNARVNLNINNNFTLVDTANELGNWWIIADTSLYALGTHTYTVIAEVNGQLSEESDTYIFRTAQRFRGDQGNLYPSELTTPRITSPKDRSLSSSKQITISGIGPANTQIELFAGDRLIGSAFSNPLGDWNFIFNMTDSQNSLTTRACIDDTCTEFSESVLIFFSGDVASCRPLFKLEDYRFWGLRRNDGVNLKIDLLSGQPPYQVLLDWGDGNIENITLHRDKDIAYHHVYKDIGQHNGSITIEDSRGCQNTHYFSVSVTKDFQQTPWAIIITIATLVSLVAALTYYIKNQEEENKSLTQTINRILDRKSEKSPDTEPDPHRK